MAAKLLMVKVKVFQKSNWSQNQKLWYPRKVLRNTNVKYESLNSTNQSKFMMVKVFAGRQRAYR